MGELKTISRGKYLKQSINDSLKNSTHFRDTKDFLTYYKDIPSELGVLASKVINFLNPTVQDIFISFARSQEDVKYGDSYGVRTHAYDLSIIEVPTKPLQASVSDCFNGCIYLLKVNSLDTSNVISLRAFLMNCKNIQTIVGVEDWNVSKCDSIYGLFSGLLNIGSLNLSKWKLNSLTDATRCFAYGVYDTIDIRGWKLPAISLEMFNDSTIKKLIVSNCDISRTKNCSYMFARTVVETIDISTWDPTYLTDSAFNNLFTNSKVSTILLPEGFVGISRLFCGCTNLNTIKIGDRDFYITNKTTTCKEMFSYCNSIKELDFTTWDFSNVKDLSFMFYFSGASGINIIHNAGNMVTSKCTTLRNVFDNCLNLTTVEGIEQWDTSNVEEWQYAFRGDSKLIVPIEKFDFSSTTNLDYAFFNCVFNKSLTNSKFVLNAPNLQSCSRAFNTAKFAEIEITTSNSLNAYMMFNGINTLKKVTIKNPVKILNAGYMFQNCINLTEISLDKMDMSECVDFSELFNHVKYNSLDLDWTSAKNANYNNMFYTMELVSSISMPNMDMDGTCHNMFSGCPKLTYVKLKSADLLYHSQHRTSKTVLGMFGNNSTITNIDCKFSNIMESRDISVNSAPLNRETVLKIIDGLYEYSSTDNTKELLLSETSYNYLQDDDFNLAYEKGWKLSC